MLAIAVGSLLAERYEIMGILGQGGMGVVYRAHDRMLEEDVAIKVLRVDRELNEEMSRRLRAETRLARRVTHPNVCRIHEYAEDGPTCYISMELLEGDSLREELKGRPSGYPAAEAFDLTLQIASGLEAIHDVGIVHRDLKTPNIVRTSSGMVRLMDFGIAKDTGLTAGDGLTMTGQIVGTPEYMSPEQCRGEKVDSRSDIYALGIVCFELFTGHVPFSGDSLTATLLKQLQEPPPLDHVRGQRIPSAVRPVLSRALAKSAKDRYASVRDFSDAMSRAQEEQAAAHTREPEATVALDKTSALSERRRHPRLDAHVDLIIRRLEGNGSVPREERTIADNISARGARVLTTLTGLDEGDVVVVAEVHGDFHTRAAIRGSHLGRDSVRRLSLEFLDRSAPAHLVGDASAVLSRAIPRATSPTPSEAATTGHKGASSAAPGHDRRTESRLRIPIDLNLKRLSAGGSVVQEERTITEDISRSGARVMTSMTSLAVGDVVKIERLDSDFACRAQVRNNQTGNDGVRRLGLVFLDRRTSDTLVGDFGEPVRRPDRAANASRLAARMSALPATASGAASATAVSTPPVGVSVSGNGSERRTQVMAAYDRLDQKDHFEVLGVPRSVSDQELKQAYGRLMRAYHPDTYDPSIRDLNAELQALFIRVGAAYEVLKHPVRRRDYARTLPPPPETPPVVVYLPPVEPDSPPAAGKPLPSGAGPSGEDAERHRLEPSPHDPETDTGDPLEPAFTEEGEPNEEEALASAEETIGEARKLIAAEKFWDAIVLLEKELPTAPSRRLRSAMRILLARATLRNPKWRKRGEELLLAIIGEDRDHMEAHLALARLYKTEGLRQRAVRMFHRVLELDPGQSEAVAELRTLDH